MLVFNNVSVPLVLSILRRGVLLTVQNVNFMISKKNNAYLFANSTQKFGLVINVNVLKVFKEISPTTFVTLPVDHFKFVSGVSANASLAFIKE